MNDPLLMTVDRVDALNARALSDLFITCPESHTRSALQLPFQKPIHKSKSTTVIDVKVMIKMAKAHFR